MKVRICFVLLAVVLAVPRLSFAETLFGQNYTMMSYLYYDYGDGDLSYLNDGHAGSILVNMNKASDEDIQLAVDFSDANGKRLAQNVEISTLTFKADLVHTFAESDTIKPYFNIGLRAQDIDVTGPATETDDTDVGLGIGIGIEFELNEALMAKISGEHDNVGDDINYFTALLGCWLTEDIMGTIGIGRETNADSTYAQVGLVVAF